MTHSGNNIIEISVPLVLDSAGYLGRECPLEGCKKYFKVLPGTGLQGTNHCICPYCGHKDTNEHFFTEDQVKRFESAAWNTARDIILREFKKIEFDIQPRGGFGIGVSMRVEEGAPIPLHVYSEKDLETHITCGNCTLKYAVYGVFAYCPDCGEPNTFQIFHENIKVILKAIENSKSVDPELAQNMIENAFEDCVSTFDGFGRELCNIHRVKSKFPDRLHKLNFQNLETAKTNFKNHFDMDLEQGLNREEWSRANTCFLKRHLLAHKFGIIDEEYIRRSGDTKAVLGRKVSISSDDTLTLIPIIEKLAEYMIDSLSSSHGNP
jgi:Zn ribbon nucleic-acid-binding protein